MKMTTAYRVEGEPCQAKIVVEVATPAKINLYLEVLGKRPDGFHELETLMTAVNWFDRLRFVSRPDEQIHLHLLNPIRDRNGIPTDHRNLIIRALNRLREESGLGWLHGCDVLLYKAIPSEAGLGGASSDAAAALLAGNLLWNLNVSKSKLHELAAQIGSDVPFFLYGGAAICRGRGERIEELKARGGLPVVIVKPPTGLSTREVFSQLQLPRNARSIETILRCYEAGSPNQIGKALFNQLTETAAGMNHQIREIAEQFTRTTAIGHQMSGSGSSYFGLFPSLKTARQAGRWLSLRLPESGVFVGQTLGTRTSRISVRQYSVR